MKKMKSIYRSVFLAAMIVVSACEDHDHRQKMGRIDLQVFPEPVQVVKGLVADAQGDDGIHQILRQLREGDLFAVLRENSTHDASVSIENHARGLHRVELAVVEFLRLRPVFGRDDQIDDPAGNPHQEQE